MVFVKSNMEKFEEIVNRKPPCNFCKGTGKHDFECRNNITVYGKTLKEISQIIDFAIQHGYKTKEIK